MKKILAFALLLLSLLPIFTVSIAGRDSIAIRKDLFYSEKELNKFGMDKKATENPPHAPTVRKGDKALKGTK